MARTRNLRIRNAHTLQSPPPSLPCGYCNRTFTNLSGRNRHRRRKHADLDGIAEPRVTPSFHPSPVLNADQSSTPPTTPLAAHDEADEAEEAEDFNMDIDPVDFEYMDIDPVDFEYMDVDLPEPDPNGHSSTPPPHEIHYAAPSPRQFGQSSSLPPDLPSPSNRDTPLSQRADTPTVDSSPPPEDAEDAPPTTRRYHSKLNGKYSVFALYQVLNFILAGSICDEDGKYIPPGSPPPPQESDRGPDIWIPFEDRVEFELGDFFSRRNQMSEGDINFILGLWAASLAVHNDEPPFANADDMHNKIDSITLGDAPWESFTLQYNGPRPDGEVPPWMTSDYDVWFRDPRVLVHNLLSNPDFKDEFDYAPFQEHSHSGAHRFQDFMSGNWSWRQAVCALTFCCNLCLHCTLQDIIAEDADTHGSVFCPIILGSDKTTVSVATGHNEYWPVYLSIGNIRNNVRRAHRNGLVLLGFLAIPKCKYLLFLVFVILAD